MQMWGERETRATAGELQGEVRGGGEETSGIRKCRQGWKLEGLTLSFPNGLSDPRVVCKG